MKIGCRKRDTINLLTITPTGSGKNGYLPPHDGRGTYTGPSSSCEPALRRLPKSLGLHALVLSLTTSAEHCHGLRE